MAKKQTRRSISVSRATYERLKAFCETNNISMSQLVETRVNDFLGGDVPAPPAPPISHHVHQGFSAAPAPSPFRPVPAMAPRPVAPPARPIERPLAVAPAPIAAAPVAPPSIAPVASVLASAQPVAAAPVASPSIAPAAPAPIAAPPVAPAPVAPVAQQVPMTSAAARFAVEPPPPIIKPRPQPDAVVPKPTEKRADQIFTF